MAPIATHQTCPWNGNIVFLPSHSCSTNRACNVGLVPRRQKHNHRRLHRGPNHNPSSMHETQTLPYLSRNIPHLQESLMPSFFPHGHRALHNVVLATALCVYVKTKKYVAMPSRGIEKFRRRNPGGKFPKEKKKKRSKFTSHSASAFFCTRKYAAFFEKVPTVVCMQYSHYRIVTTLSEKKKTPSDAEKLIPKDTIFREHVICGLFFVPRVCQEITIPPVCCAKMTGPSSSSLLQPPFPPCPGSPHSTGLLPACCSVFPWCSEQPHIVLFRHPSPPAGSPCQFPPPFPRPPLPRGCVW